MSENFLVENNLKNSKKILEIKNIFYIICNDKINVPLAQLARASDF